MKKFAIILVLPFLLSSAFELVPVLPDPTPVAEAARIGGGRSIGSRPSYNRSAPAPSRQPGPAQNAPGSAGMAPRGGFMGGMLGPLLAGSMLGALFFGGAFSGIGMADIAIIMLGVWMISRLLRSRRSAPAHDSRQASQQRDGAYSDAWSHLRSGQNPTGPQMNTSPGFTAPAGFDQQKFMDGARMIYSRMQESWDKRDLDDIRQFTTPGMFKLIEEQAKEDPTPSRTTVLTMSAQPHEFQVQAGEEMISVYFDVLLREYEDRNAENAREIWHFARPTGQGTWKLDGIQQVE